MTSIRVLNTFPIGEEDAKQLAAISPRLEFVHVQMDRHGLDELEDEQLEVLIGGRLPGKPDQTPALRWLQIPSGGVQRLQVPSGGLERWRLGVTVTNGRGTYSFAVAEYVLWALVDYYQRGEARRQLQREQRWPPQEDEDPVLGRRLRGQTLLLVGYGSVGRQIARHASGLGMRVLAVKADPEGRAANAFCIAGTGDPEGRIPERIGSIDEVSDFAGEADVVVVTLPLTDRTRGVIDGRVLAAMRSHALLVVVGRGETIDTQAVRNALDSGQIGGAVMDGFPSEPLSSDDPLWAQSGLVITPHIAGGVAGDPIGHDWGLFFQLVVENLHRYLDDRPLLNVVDLARGY